MLVIRFSRVGKKNHAQYKLVLAEKTYPIQGKFIEQLGSYDPHQKKAKLDKKRIVFWIEKGAQCSDSVHNLLIREGAIKGKKRFLKIGKKKKEEENKEVKSDDKKDSKDDDKKNEDNETEEKVEEKKEEIKESSEKKPENSKEEIKQENKTEEISKDKKVEKEVAKPSEKREEKK